MSRWRVPDRANVFEDDHVSARPLDYPRDVEPLFAAASVAANGEDIFRFSLATGPFPTQASFAQYLKKRYDDAATLSYVVAGKRMNRVVGAFSFLNIKSDHGVIEIGSIWYCKAAQRTAINTHTMYLAFRYVFEDLGYRRLEWKCNDRNDRSKAAALRLGFQFEGVFRQHFWDKEANRDTAWYSLLDREWPAARLRFEQQLLRPAVAPLG